MCKTRFHINTRIVNAAPQSQLNGMKCHSRINRCNYLRVIYNI